MPIFFFFFSSVNVRGKKSREEYNKNNGIKFCKVNENMEALDRKVPLGVLSMMRSILLVKNQLKPGGGGACL